MGLGSGRVPSFVMGCTELLATLSLYAAGSVLALTFRCSSTVAFLVERCTNVNYASGCFCCSCVFVVVFNVVACCCCLCLLVTSGVKLI